MSFQPDYPGAIVAEANPNNYGYTGTTNNPVAIVLHTPEETADNDEVTPRWFQNPAAGGSTHYYLDNDGDVYQMVPEAECPYANGVTMGKNAQWKGTFGARPPWGIPGVTLNAQTISIEIEGFANSIQDTLGPPQYVALLSWIKYVADKYSIPLDRDHIIGHFEVATDRTDPGAGFPWDRLMADLAGAPVAPPQPKPSDVPVPFNYDQQHALQEAVGRGAVIVPRRHIKTGVRFNTNPGYGLLVDENGVQPPGYIEAGEQMAEYSLYIRVKEGPVQPL